MTEPAWERKNVMPALLRKCAIAARERSKNCHPNDCSPWLANAEILERAADEIERLKKESVMRQSSLPDSEQGFIK